MSCQFHFAPLCPELLSISACVFSEGTSLVLAHVHLAYVMPGAAWRGGPSKLGYPR